MPSIVSLLLTLLAFLAIVQADAGERRQIDSVFNSVTSVAGSALSVGTAGAASVFSQGTSLGGSAFTDATSAAGSAFTAATSAAGSAASNAASRNAAPGLKPLDITSGAVCFMAVLLSMIAGVAMTL